MMNKIYKKNRVCSSSHDDTSQMDISSYRLPQELRLCLSDAKCDKVSGKFKRIENELADFEISSKH